MTVLVTGASGCIGRAVISALRAAGYTTVSAGTSAPLDDSVEHVEWDIRTPADNRFTGYDITAVIHAAGVSGAHLSRDDAHGANVTGTRNVLDAFPKARFIYLSCADVYDPRRGYKDLYEERGPAELDCFTTEYERSKVEAENVVTRLRPDALILRPAPVYGPGDRRNFPFIQSLASKKGLVELPGGGRQKTALASSDNVAAAVLAGLKHPEAYGPINVADPEPYVLRDAINTFMARAGLVPFRFDERAADLALTTAWMREKTGRKPKDGLDRYAVRKISQSRSLNLGRLRRLLGVEPVQGLARRDS